MIRVLVVGAGLWTGSSLIAAVLIGRGLRLGVDVAAGLLHTDVPAHVTPGRQFYPALGWVDPVPDCVPDSWVVENEEWLGGECW